MRKYSMIFWMLLGLISLSVAIDLDADFRKLRTTGIQHLKTMQERRAAIDICLKFIQQYGNDPTKKDIVSDAYLLSGQIRRMIGLTESDNAITDLKAGLDRDPNNPNLNRELGLIYLDMEEWKESKQYLEGAVGLNSNDLEAHRGLIKLAEQTGNDSLLVIYYMKYLKVDSSNATIWVKLGKKQQSLGQDDKAEISYERALRIDPTRTDALQALAGIKEKKGELAEAAEKYKAISISDPTSSAARARVAELEHKLEKQQRVEEHLQRGQSYLNSQKVQNWVLSITEFYKVLENQPENEMARQNIARARKKLFDHYYKIALGQEDAKNWQTALEFYSTSLVYAESDDDRQMAFDKQKIVAGKLGKVIEAQNAQAAADSALNDEQFREALTKYVAAELLDPSLREQIKPKRVVAEVGENYQLGMDAFNDKRYEATKTYFSLVTPQSQHYGEAQVYLGKADTLLQIAILRPRYEAAMRNNRWHVAWSYLIDLTKLAPDSLVFRQDLELAKQQVWNDRTWRAVRVAILILSPIPLIVLLFLNKRVKEAFRKALRSLLTLLPPWRLRIAAVVVVSVSTIGLIYYLVRFNRIPDISTIPGMTTLASIIIFAFIVVMALLRKRTIVHLGIQAQQFGFYLKKEAALNFGSLSLGSLNLQSIGLLKINKDNKDEVEVYPQGGDFIKSVELLPTRVPFSIKSLRLSPGLRLSLRQNNGTFHFEAQGKAGFIILEMEGRLKMQIDGGQLFSDGARTRPSSSIKSEAVEVDLSKSNSFIYLQISEALPTRLSFILKVSDKSRGSPSLLENIQGEKLTFVKRSAFLTKAAAPMPQYVEKDFEKGYYEIHGIGKTELSEFRAKPARFRKLRVGLNGDGEFLLEYEVPYTCFQVKDDSRYIEKIPTVLSWFVMERRELAWIISAAVVLAGIILSVFDVFRR